MYAVMAVITLIVSVAWMLVLWKNRGQVFAIHYLMAMFMFIKVLSITFHAVSFFNSATSKFVLDCKPITL